MFAASKKPPVYLESGAEGTSRSHVVSPHTSWFERYILHTYLNKSGYLMSQIYSTKCLRMSNVQPRLFCISNKNNAATTTTKTYTVVPSKASGPLQFV